MGFCIMFKFVGTYTVNVMELYIEMRKYLWNKNYE